MTTSKESFLATKFDLNFRLEFVTVADSLQDLGEMELPTGRWLLAAMNLNDSTANSLLFECKCKILKCGQIFSSI